MKQITAHIENETLVILKTARELIANGWTQGTYARDRNDRSISYCDARAVKFCSIGAINRAATGWQSRKDVISMFGYALPVWNDEPGRTQADVLALFDKFITRCSK